MPPRKNTPAPVAETAPPAADTDSFDSVSAPPAGEPTAEPAAEVEDPVAAAELAALNAQYAPNSTVEETTDLVPVVALSLINGTVQPGTIFTPASIDELAELRGLHAVRNLNEAEAALFAAKSAE